MIKKVLISVFISLLVISVALFFYLNESKKTDKKIQYIHNEGNTQGTYYSATYLQPEGIDLQKKMESRMHEFDLSLSTYDSTSVISHINRNDNSVKTDIYFETMFNTARQVSEHTNGAFDITVGPLVKAWGFGFGNEDHTKIPNIKNILPNVGYKKVRIENHQLLKSNSKILIDANAIAQGYSSDIIAKLLEDNGCKNYMIEIGGEIVCKGLNPEGKKWRIGIDKPIDDITSSTTELQTIVSLSNIALTTSGNYRKFYYLNGKKYAHTIDPRTGYPVVHNLLSATVAAPTCIMADAYATAFMVIGVDSSLQICKSIPNMDCYLIYTDKNGKNQVVYTDGFKKYIE
jgi:thiamine biosynthesis lipoprotein